MSGLAVRVAAPGVASYGPDAVLISGLLPGDNAADLPEPVRARARGAVERGEARSHTYDMTMWPASDDHPAVLLIGTGDRNELDGVRLRRLAAAASRYATGRGYRRLVFLHRGAAPARLYAHAMVEGAINGAYEPGIKKTGERRPRALDEIVVVGADQAALSEGARLGQIVGESARIARELVNLPPNELTPSVFAERAETLARDHRLACEVYGPDWMRSQGMGSFLGVAAGSDQEPRLIRLHYGPEDAPVKLALVGKGLTFDSGGLSIKPASGMETMKSDMGGGAAVVAGMVAVSRLAPEGISITGYIGATENMPGGNAMRPGDVLIALNGKTIEVLNTDAEGRLVLADVLAYAVQQGATHIVDFATLTGGAVVALGEASTLAAGRPMAWVREVVAAAEDGLERAWPMPLFEEYRQAMDSEVADIKNSGGRSGSPLTATAFLSEFVDHVDWAHLDIAGTAFAEKATPYRSTGGTGAGVGTIAALVLHMADGKDES